MKQEYNNCYKLMKVIFCILLLCILIMEPKCLFEARGDSNCSKTCSGLIKLSDIEENELIINRCSLPVDLS